jgi:tetratricopeptide (TPR) repeat protein
MAEPLIEFIAHTGQAGVAWVGEYRRHCHVLRQINQALSLLRSGKIDQAEGFLLQAAEALHNNPRVPESVRAVLEQAYHKALGLYYYRAGKLHKAARSMQQAHEAVDRAVEECDFLIPFALQCPDLCLNQARVARNMRNWDEMHNHIRRMQAMLSDRIPLCGSARGPRVFYSTLRELFVTIDHSSAPGLEELCAVMEEERRLPFYDRLIRGFFRFETTGIDYQ